MSTHPLRRFGPAFALALALGSTGFAIAGAVSLQDVANANLAPSSVPALLGPITEAGRKGWACTPERAAAAKNSVAAELPSERPSR